MKIIELAADNFKKLKIRRVIDGDIITVKGKNGAGKTTALDIAWVALTGQNVPSVPIKQGEEEGTVEAQVKRDDGSVITVIRKFKQTLKGITTSLIVKSADGARYTSPQTFLDEMIGSISFDPFDFIHMQPAKQKKFLMDLLGIDLTELEAKKRGALDDLDLKRKALTSIEIDLKTYDDVEVVEEVNTASLLEEINAMNKLQEDFDTLKRATDGLLTSWNERQKGFAEIDNEIQQLQLKITELEKNKRDLEITQDQTQKEFEAEQLKVLNFKIHTAEDYAAKQKVLSDAGETNKKAVRYQEKVKKQDDLKASQIDKEDAQKKVNSIEDQRVKMIESVKMPIDKLTFSEDGLMYDGLPFTEEQLSHAKILEIGIAISIALNPKLRIMRVKDGSLLDEETLEMIKNKALTNDYQLFIEIVSNDKEIGFEIS